MIRAYSHFQRVREIIDKEIVKMLDVSLIKPSNSDRPQSRREDS